MTAPHPKIGVAILTHDRPVELATLLAALQTQSVPTSVVVVDSGANSSEAIVKRFESASYIRSLTNLGGAGGFSLAILNALAIGAEWVWIVDDDGCPLQADCLQALLDGARRLQLDLVAPVIVDPVDPSRLSFPLRVGRRFTYDFDKLAQLEIIPGVAHLFNGALVRRDVFFRIGLPQMQLFIRGDEVDFLLRLRRARVSFGTLPSVRFCHPSGEGEVVHILRGQLFVLIPQTEMKRYYFFRNRGYLARRHRRIRSFFADILLYPFVFLVMQRFNVEGLKSWARAYGHGLTYTLAPPSPKNA